MIRCMPRWLLAGTTLAAMVTGGSILVGEVEGQDAVQTIQQEGPAKKPAKKKSGGRLPPGYGDVVTEEQRQKIYDIQRKYQDQIDQLQSQLDALREKRDSEVEAVLTPEQRKQVEANRAAKKKAAKKEPPKKEPEKKKL